MTEPASIPAVAYAAKSNEDTHGSIETQLADARELARRDGLDLPPEREFKDEAKSAYHGNRGPNLARAMAECERLAREGDEDHKPVLIVQHSDRLARGDAKQAKHLVEYALWAIKAGVTIRSMQDPQTFGDLLYAVVTGQRNHEDSARKSAATTDGLKRRKERGQPVGSMPLGYAVEGEIIDGRPITRRVVDEDSAAVVRSIFVSIEEGASPGSIARRLNLGGLRTKRGKAWEARAVRRIAENPVFAGEGGYPAIVSFEQADRTVASLKRMDPAAAQRRKGGRAPQDDSFILRGIARCLVCDAALWTRRSPQTGARSYVCRHRRQGTRVCTAEPIPALLIEEHVLSHLTAFVGDAETWALEQVQEREQDRTARLRALGGLRSEAADLDRRRALVLDDYTAAVAENDPKARIVLEVIDRLDGQATALAGALLPPRRS
jgi:DNA invertase Pin-like site-specific DNA recombinase